MAATSSAEQRSSAGPFTSISDEVTARSLGLVKARSHDDVTEPASPGHPQPADRIRCKCCHRKFAESAIARHEPICVKNRQKELKRQGVFDWNTEHHIAAGAGGGTAAAAAAASPGSSSATTTTTNNAEPAPMSAADAVNKPAAAGTSYVHQHRPSAVDNPFVHRPKVRNSMDLIELPPTVLLHSPGSGSSLSSPSSADGCSDGEVEAATTAAVVVVAAAGEVAGDNDEVASGYYQRRRAPSPPLTPGIVMPDSPKGVKGRKRMSTTQRRASKLSQTGSPLKASTTYSTEADQQQPELQQKAKRLSEVRRVWGGDGGGDGDGGGGSGGGSAAHENSKGGGDAEQPSMNGAEYGDSPASSLTCKLSLYCTLDTTHNLLHITTRSGLQ